MNPPQCRPYNLEGRRTIRDLDPSDIDKLISVEGMVTRTSSTIPDLRLAKFRWVFQIKGGGWEGWEGWAAVSCMLCSLIEPYNLPPTFQPSPTSPISFPDHPRSPPSPTCAWPSSGGAAGERGGGVCEWDRGGKEGGQRRGSGVGQGRRLGGETKYQIAVPKSQFQNWFGTSSAFLYEAHMTPPLHFLRRPGASAAPTTPTWSPQITLGRNQSKN